MKHNINKSMTTGDDEALACYFYQDDYERRPSSSTSTSTTSSSSSSSKRSSLQFVSSVRQSLRLSTLFNRRRSSVSSSNLTRFSLSALSPSSSSCTVVDDEPLSPKQMEIEQMIESFPERTVRFSVTPDFAI